MLTALVAAAGTGVAARAGPAGSPPPERASLTASTGPAPAQGMFLVASRTLRDPNFARSVVLLLAYGEQGAVGLVVNAVTGRFLRDLVPDVDGIDEREDRLYRGGPVYQGRVRLLLGHERALDETANVFGDVYVSGSQRVLRWLLERRGPEERFRVYVGYAGWGPAQLDGELARGDWLLVPADAESIFTIPVSEVWPRLIRIASGRWVEGPGRGPSQALSSSAPDPATDR